MNINIHLKLFGLLYFRFKEKTIIYSESMASFHYYKRRFLNSELLAGVEFIEKAKLSMP